MKRFMTFMAVIFTTATSVFAADGDLIVDGNLGVGTTAPSQKLHVSNGVALFDKYNIGTNADANSGLRIVAPIGTTHYNWMIGAQQNVAAAMEFTPSTTVGGTTFSTPVMTIKQNGNVGIGINPNYKLDIADTVTNVSKPTVNIIQTKVVTTNGQFYNLGLSSNPAINILNGVADTGYAIGTRSYALRTQSLDEGTLTELSAIDTAFGHYGPVNRTSHRVYGLNLRPYAVGGTITNMYALYIDRVATGGTITNNFSIYQADVNAINYFAGNVGIGTSTPAYDLDVNGIIRGNNVTPSDIRFKENIAPIEAALDKVNTIQGVSYNWKKSDTGNNFPAGRHYGVIAQEIEKVLPEVVSTAPDGTKAVAYTEIIPVLIEAIKEQQKRIDSLEKRLAELQ